MSAGAGLSGGACGESGAAMLTAHQRLHLLRRFPEAEITYPSEIEVFVRFPNGDTVWAIDKWESHPGSVLAQRPTGYHSTFGPVQSCEATDAEAVLREFIGC